MASARIVYASLTGNNEDIASIIEEAFEDLNVDVTTTEVSQALASDFEDAIFVSRQLTRTQMLAMANCRTKRLISMKNCKSWI